jgi:hypothetical protein
MNQYSKISDGLAGWLAFELRCGRKELFRESLIAQPLHQLLNYRFPGRVLCEVNHPVLSPLAKGPGRKPSIDFAVTGENNRYSAVIETKWVSKSQTILRDLIRDIIRLDLLVPSIADEGFIILAGNKRDIKALFEDSQFQPHPENLNSKHILPLGNHCNASVRFLPIPKFREKLYTDVLRIFQDIEITKSIPLERSGPFPKLSNADHYEVYLWRLKKNGERDRFYPKDYYKFKNKA